MIGYYSKQISRVYSPLLNDGSQRSASMPIVPLTQDGLLIPFEASDPWKGMTRGALPRTNRYPSNLKSFNDIQQQIQQRAQLLAGFQKLRADQVASAALHSRNAPARSVPTFSSSLPRPTSSYSSGLSRPLPTFSSSMPLPPSINRSQPPYTSGNVISSSSSSSRSSASSTRPMSSNRPPTLGGPYGQPSFGGSRGQYMLSGPSAAYQSLQP
ncbi:unnamed protein product [Rotaria sp. Silwood2]|nr:unnamed protein product [Rotaria sp. Silwood2]CAF2774653.1 unnamed protein product [Rotaria sp. Silwood2]CAF3096790.1 unnamed protein product [Rotaria sp. Silwood2]CAF3157995.1 unnamed protein product [Rotaria sp. Silwood2]CAF4171694.1 unnamed protein product [Rotaria sp. Silwood2]